MRFAPTPRLVATLAFVTLGFTRGLHSSFGVFYVALLDTFGWSRGATAGVFSMVLTVDAMLSPVVGYLLDRFGTKKIVCSSCFILALGLLLSSTIDSLWQLYVFFGLISAVGITFTGMCPMCFWFRSGFSPIVLQRSVSSMQGRAWIFYCSRRLVNGCSRAGDGRWPFKAFSGSC